jgi:uncharacterized protein (DUF58 family)
VKWFGRSRGRPSPPSPPPPFPAAFGPVLASVLAAPARIDSGRNERWRARRSVLSQSGSFIGHRRYERGDDLRRLDWAAFARTGELFTKQLEEEERRAVSVLVDLSPSLCCGTPARRTGALRLAAVLAGLALRRLDGVTVIAPGADEPVRRFTGVAELPLVLRHLAALPIAAAEPADATALAHGRDVVGRVHWVSDFATPAAFERPLAMLRRRGGRVTGWLPSVPEDNEPPARGYLRVVDPEAGEDLDVPVDEALRRELARELEALARQQNRLFQQVGAPLWRWPVPAADELAIEPYLAIVRAARA